MQQLHLKVRLLCTSSNNNWCIINDGTNYRNIVMGVSSKPPKILKINFILQDKSVVIRWFTGSGTMIIDHGPVFVTFICNEDTFQILSMLYKWIQILFILSYKLKMSPLSIMYQCVNKKEATNNHKSRESLRAFIKVDSLRAESRNKQTWPTTGMRQNIPLRQECWKILHQVLCKISFVLYVIYYILKWLKVRME